MAITSYSTKRAGQATIVTVVSSLSGTIYYHWWVDGVYAGQTTTPSRSFTVRRGEQARIECIDTNDADYDAQANTPAGWPARRQIWWIRSLSTDVAWYRVEQLKSGGSWAAIGLVPHRDAQWSYSVLSPRLDDLSDYTWRVVAVDQAGNETTTATVGPVTVVRAPDAPDFAYTWNGPSPATTTISAA